MHPIPRRDFVAFTAASAATFAAASMLGARAFGSQDSAPKAGKPLKILVLGGTVFLGPAIVDAALARGHTVTLFNRGKHNTDLYPQLEKLRGDRDPNKKTAEGAEGLKSLEGREWDVVIDDCGYFPRMVKASAELLAPKVKQYIYISSISAHKEGVAPNSDESAPLTTLADPTAETFGKNYENYGGGKAMCEQAAEAAMPGRVTNIRPGFIIGPRDFSGRFTYWPLRVREGGEMIGPGNANDPLQVIDVRDLAEWTVKCAENKTVGTFIATGPKTPTSIGAVIDASIRAAKKTKPSLDTTVTWIPADFLESQKVGAGGDLPLWLPPVGEYAGFHRWNVSKAVDAGLTFRSLDDTITALMAWYDTLPPEEQAKTKAGMPREREAEVLKAWREKK